MAIISESAAALRRLAEEKAVQSPEIPEALSPEEAQRVLHELRVHQIELEMQNEELRRTQAELAAARARYFDLYDLAPVGYVTLGETGLILEANLTIATMLGVTRGELVKRSFSRFVVPEDQDLYYLHRKQLLASGEPHDCEVLRLIRKDAAPFWVRMEVNTARDADGAPVCRAVVVDITRHKRAEAELRKSEQQFRTFSGATQEAFILLDDQGAVTFWNPAAERIFGYGIEEMLGQPLHQLLAPARYHEAQRQAYDHFAATGHGPVIGKTVELDALRKNGVEFPIELSLSGFQLGDHWYAGGIIRDITDRKLAEAELLQAKEAAEVASRAKSRFLANMSHELRTPMNGVLGMIQVAQFGPLDAKQRSYLDLAYRSGWALVRILDDILDMTKIEERQLTLNSELFPLRECVAGTVGILTSEAAHKGLQLVTSVADDVPVTVVGDQHRLRQVLTNLVGNAVKFTEQGTVTVRVALDPWGVTFTVTDTGIGIPADKLNLLFKPFSQVDDTDTRRYGGTGLGLAISREIVALMGGTITMASVEGHGSTFSFTLPLGHAAPRILPRLQGCPERGSTPLTPRSLSEVEGSRGDGVAPRILIVEDDPTNRALLQLALKHKKYLTETANHGLQAVEKWENGSYDLIIMDVQMPVMDGIAATQAIREKERERGGHTRILAMTAHASRDDEARCLTSGMDAYLAKPVDLSELIAVVGKLVLERAEAQHD